jgi:ABC-type amino acid transport substrate-binding protein
MRAALLALGISIVATEARAAAAAPRTALAAIEARGTLRALVILDDEHEFFSGTSGELPGLDYELLEGFARMHKVKLELVPVASWDGLVPALLQERGDLIAGRFTVTDARKQLIDFTVETFPTRNVVVTRRPHRRVLTLDELRKERVSVVKGTSMAALLPALGVPPANIDLSVPTGGILVAMKNGKITCTVHEVYTAIVAQRNDPAIEMGLFIGPPLSLAYGVRKTDPELLAALNTYIANVRRSTMWSRLVVKYFGDAALTVIQEARKD